MPSIIDKGKVIVTTRLVALSDTTPQVLYTCMPPYMKYVLRKVIIYNKDTADHEITIGSYDTTNLTWVEDKLIVKVPTGSMKEITPDILPADFVMTSDPAVAIMAWATKLDTAVTANNVYVKAEFEVM